MDEPVEPKDNLPRLLRHHYQGHAVVMWTLTLEQRASGWLNEVFHCRFRELLLHAAARENVWCPAYCLMADHVHLVWMGLTRESDQLNAMRFLRRQLAPLLKPHKFQHQAHDHILRKRNAGGVRLRASVFMCWRTPFAPNSSQKSKTGRSAARSCLAIRCCIRRKQTIGNYSGNCMPRNGKPSRPRRRCSHYKASH